MQNILSKLLGGIVISTFATLANAEVSNVWQITLGQGNMDLDIRAKNIDQVFGISCNFDQTHYINFLDYTSARVSKSDPKNIMGYDLEKINYDIPEGKFYKSLSIKIDGKTHNFFPLSNSNVKKKSNEWKKFAGDISVANKFEIIRNGKPIATFYPSFKSMKNIKKIKDC